MSSGYTETITPRITAPAGELGIEFRGNIKTVRVLFAPRPFRLYAGYGRGLPIADIDVGGYQDIDLPSPDDRIFLTWDTDSIGRSGNAVLLVTGADMNPITLNNRVALSLTEYTDPLKQHKAMGWASAAHRADGQTQAHVLASQAGAIVPMKVQDLQSDRWYASRSPSGIQIADELVPDTGVRYADTFGVVGKRTGALDIAVVFAAAGRACAQLWIPAIPFLPGNVPPALSVKWYLEMLQVAIYQTSAAVRMSLEVTHATPAMPLTGVALLPERADSAGNNGMAGAVMRNPTGTIELGNPYVGTFADIGITGAVPVTNPPPSLPWITLIPWGESQFTRKPYASINAGDPAAVALALMIEVSAACTMRVYTNSIFTQEYS